MTPTKTIIATVALVVATPVFSGEQSFCKSLGELAYGIMELRQEGLPMSMVMGISEDKLVQGMVMDAYNRPRFSTDSYKQEAMENFRNDVEALCYKKID